jgi:hypothetical protein
VKAFLALVPYNRLEYDNYEVVAATDLISINVLELKSPE